MTGNPLLESFEQELRSSVEKSKRLLRSLEQSESKAADLREVHRLAHSAKGTSGMVGLFQIERIADLVEDQLHRLVRNDAVPDPALVDLLVESLEALLAAYEAFVSGGSFDEDPALKKLAAAIGNRAT